MGEPIAVVGGGVAGLSVSATLASHDQEVVLVERLPAVGGTWGFDNKTVISLAGRCRELGLKVILGTTACTWALDGLRIVGPGSVGRVRARHLVFAGGSRPATASELGIVGGRVAGVFAAPVAVHLMEAGVTLGRNVVLSGLGDWTWQVAQHCPSATRLTVVGGNRDVAGLPDCDSWWPEFQIRRIVGAARVCEVIVDNASVTSRIACDGVILCGSNRPVRSIDGAVFDEAPRVTYVQSTSDGLTEQDVEKVAKEAALSLLNFMEESQW